MDPVHKAVLRTHRLELSGQLLVSDTIVPFLYQENILTQNQVEDVESQPTNRQKTLKLLDILPSRGPRAFDTFLRSLEEFTWLRDKLLLELQARPEPGSTGESIHPTVTTKQEVIFINPVKAEIAGDVTIFSILVLLHVMVSLLPSLYFDCKIKVGLR